MQCQTHSVAQRTSVLELYTSEGCSSCPPADHWLSTLPARGLTADRVVALAFHVDYWDSLGWPDRMASPQFSARQREQAQRNRAGFVYTPQLLLNGADYRALFSAGRLEARLAELDRVRPAAELSLSQRIIEGAVEVELQVRALPGSARRPQIYVAITESRLQSQIQAGENRGKLLHHDFVVRKLIGPLPLAAEGTTRWHAVLGLAPHWKRADVALAAFVQDERDGDILQALSAPLCRD